MKGYTTFMSGKSILLKCHSLQIKTKRNPNRNPNRVVCLFVCLGRNQQVDSKFSYHIHIYQLELSLHSCFVFPSRLLMLSNH